MIKYHNTDNIEFMRQLPDKYYDLAIADPEQGKKEHGGTNRTQFVIQKNGSRILAQGGHEKKDWDNTPASEEYFDELFRVSKHQIIWGEQYFPRYFGKGRIVWDKVNEGSAQYDCEIAYNSLNDRTELFRFMWRGMMQGKSMNEGHVQQGNKKLNQKIIHPTQKPIHLYLWILTHFKIPLNWKLFDPNLGSGSIGIACLKTGHNLEACESDYDYFNNAENWLREETALKTQHLQLAL